MTSFNLHESISHLTQTPTELYVL